MAVTHASNCWPQSGAAGSGWALPRLVRLRSAMPATVANWTAVRFPEVILEASFAWASSRACVHCEAEPCNSGGSPAFASHPRTVRASMPSVSAATSAPTTRARATDSRICSGEYRFTHRLGGPLSASLVAAAGRSEGLPCVE